jgi:flagellar basal-body rod protein FlgF
MSEINGMTKSAHALRYWEIKQQAVSNNLANVSTDGFKGERVFARLMGDALPVADSATDLRQGTLKVTGSPLDLALAGDGFFVVETPDGEKLSRGGSFRMNDQGQVTDAAGNRLLGEGGPIVPGQGTIEIGRGGAVRVDGRIVAQLRLERVPPDVRLQHDAGTLFLPDPAREPLDPEARQVRQGTLEESNVNSVSALVDMISIQRAYSAVQKAVHTLDGIRSTISNEIGKPA